MAVPNPSSINKVRARTAFNEGWKHLTRSLHLSSKVVLPCGGDRKINISLQLPVMGDLQTKILHELPERGDLQTKIVRQLPVRGDLKTKT